MRLTAHVPLSVRLPVTHRSDLLATGRLPVELKMPSRAGVRVTPLLQVVGRPTIALGPSRGVALGSRRPTALSLVLSARGRSALGRCPVGRVGVKVTGAPLGTPRITTKPLRLDPPECARFFGPRAIWNAPLRADAPLDDDSAAVTNDVLGKIGAGYRTGMPPTINTDSYAPPVYTVGPSQPHVRVKLDFPPSHASRLVEALSAVPLPPGARPAPGTDSELVVWQPSTDTMWEFWRLRHGADGWIASWGGRLGRVSKGPGHFTAPQANWGAAASSLPLAGGMITPRELVRGEIDHALSMALPKARSGEFSFPAQRTDGESGCPHAVPEGARFRLDPALDVDSLGLPGPVATLARAAQRYGIYVRDQSDSVSFYAQSVVSLSSDPYPAIFGGQPPYELLKAFPWSHLQLLKMDLRESPTSGPPILSPPLLGGCG